MSEEEINEQTSENLLRLSSALNLSWAFGINKSVPLLNLSRHNEKLLFYTTAHTGVLFDFHNHTQVLYQGHQNGISSSCVSPDKMWLVTADIGPNCMLIVWDTLRNLPIRTIFDIDAVGISSVAISADAKYVATLGCSLPQTLSVWDWTCEDQQPVCTLQLDPSLGLMTTMTISRDSSKSIICNNASRIVFLHWQTNGTYEISTPHLTDEDFNKTVGLYSQTVHHPQVSHHAYTATNCGNIVVWSQQCGNQWKAFKIVRLQEKPITVLTLWKNYVVTGDIAASVKFFDLELKLTNWYSNLGCDGAITGISFTDSSPKENEAIERYPTTSTLQGDRFVVDDFSISTCRANYLYFKTEGSQIQYLRKESDKDITAIGTHPNGPFLAVGGASGFLQILNYRTKQLVHSRDFRGSYFSITYLAYHPLGESLAIGFAQGVVVIVDAVTLLTDKTDDQLQVFEYSNAGVKKIAFSHNGQYLAYSDEDCCVVVLECKEGCWTYLGKNRPHYKKINDLMFTPALDDNSCRLMSVGDDRMLVEYDLKNSSVDDLRVMTSERIEQEAIPQCIATYPDITKESFIVIGNNKYKFKLYNATTKMCRKTLLGPTYGSTLQKVVILPKVSGTPNHYMAYIAKEKVGVAILPLDGNPYNSMAVVAHPGKAENIACSYDGHHVFTCGGKDTSVLMWNFSKNALEAASRLGGEGLVPFYSLIEGGREGELFCQLEQFFYYCQMRNQGTDSMKTRDVTTSIPLSEIPFIMRALGFYPSEQEVEEMINEVKFNEYVVSGCYVNSIDLEAIIKLFVNHRPAFGIQQSDIIEAFRILARCDEGEDASIERSQLLQLIQEKGEHLGEGELVECMSLLSTQNAKPDCEEEVCVELPEQVTAQHFSQNVLGFTNVC